MASPPAEKPPRDIIVRREKRTRSKITLYTNTFHRERKKNTQVQYRPSTLFFLKCTFHGTRPAAPNNTVQRGGSLIKQLSAPPPVPAPGADTAHASAGAEGTRRGPSRLRGPPTSPEVDGLAGQLCRRPASSRESVLPYLIVQRGGSLYRRLPMRCRRRPRPGSGSSYGPRLSRGRRDASGPKPFERAPDLGGRQFTRKR